MFFCGFRNTLALLFERSTVNRGQAWIPLLSLFTGMETDESQNSGIVTETKCCVLLHGALLIEEKPFHLFPFQLYKYGFKN